MGEITHRDVQGIRVLDLSGDYSSIEDAGLIESAIVKAMSDEPDGIIVNYGPVTQMTSGNYGVFLNSVVAAFKQTKDSDLCVKLLIPDDSEVHHLIEHLKISKLDTLVQVHTNEMDAVSSFCPS